MYLRFNEHLKFLVSVDFVSNCCFANVLCLGYDNPLLIFGMVFSVVVNTSPEIWPWFSCNFLVTWLVNLCLIVSWRFSWDLILQFAGCLCNLNPLSLSCITSSSFFFWNHLIANHQHTHLQQYLYKPKFLMNVPVFWNMLSLGFF